MSVQLANAAVSSSAQGPFEQRHCRAKGREMASTDGIPVKVVVDVIVGADAPLRRHAGQESERLRMMCTSRHCKTKMQVKETVVW